MGIDEKLKKFPFLKKKSDYLKYVSEKEIFEKNRNEIEEFIN